MAKYDWKQLEKEYILSEYKSVNAFLKNKGIKKNGNANKQTSGWTEKKATKEQQKSNKTVEKVIEKESEKEAQQIVNLKNIANNLALNIIKANTELDRHIAKSKTKTKTVKYDYKVSKPSEEITEEKEEISEYISIIDRQGLKMLTSALKDLNDIIGDEKETNKETIERLDEVLKGLGGVV